ncbi:MAG: T9SS type A sorting domain-containing protein, partial [candidate division Zixibacteria bacterium]|nr:T9SS type A sorting domain-containing protein [candidate division Zixibacteria bacterium]
PRARWVNTAAELLLNSPTELAGTDTDTALFVNIGDGPGLYSAATDSVLAAAFKNPGQISHLAVNYRQTSPSRENLAFGLADDMSVTARNKFFNKTITPGQKTLLLDQAPNLPNRVAYQTKDKSNLTSAAAPPAWLTINDLTGGGPVLAGDSASIEATGDASTLNFGIYYAEIRLTVTPTEPDPDLYGGTDIVLPVRFVIGFIPEEVIVSTPVVDKLVTNFAAMGDDAGVQNFVYNGVNQLFDGSTILGSTDSTLAMDVFAHSLSGIAPDSVLTLTDFTGDSTYTGTAYLATVGSQVRVVQTTRSYNDPERAGFIIYRLDITNVTDTLIPNLAVGLFLDWDIGDFNNNQGGMDTTYKVFYIYDPSDPAFRCGIMSLPFTSPVYGFQAIDNPIYVYPTSDVDDGDVWNWMSSGNFVPTVVNDTDLSMMLTLSYADLDSGETRVEEFAFFGYDTTLVTTDSLANLINGMSTGVRPIANPPAALPKSYELGQNFPNPFNATTQIRFNVPAASQVSLDVYDILGRKVRTLVNDYLTAGVKQILWDGKNQSGDQVASGVYFYRMTAGDYNQIKKMVLLK